VGIFDQIQGAVNSILPTLFEDEGLTSLVTWKKFTDSVFDEGHGVNVDTYVDTKDISAIRIEKEIGASNAGRIYPPGQWATTTGDVQYLFQFADVPDGASIRDLVVEGGITYNVKKIYPVFGLIVKVDVLGYA